VEPVYDVCDNGSSAYADIQDAIDDDATGDTITVSAGVYDAIYIGPTDEVTLIGEDAATTNIFGGAGTAAEVADGSLSIQGFSARGTRVRPSPAAFFMDGGSLDVSDVIIDACGGDTVVAQWNGASVWDSVIIENNSMATDRNLISFIGSGSTTWGHCIIRDNVATAIWDSNTLDVAFENNLVYNNAIAGSFGLRITANYSGDVDVVNNVIHGNTCTGHTSGAYALQSTNVRNTIVTDHNVGAIFGAAYYSLFHDNSGGDLSGGDDNLFADRRFTDAAAGDFTLQADYSPAIDAGDPESRYDDGDGTQNDIGGYGGPFGSG